MQARKAASSIDDPGRIWPVLWLYNLVFPVAFLLYLPFYLRRLRRRGGWRAGFGERFARYSPAKLAALGKLRRPIWLHAVSVGEVRAALRFISEWQTTEPERQFVLSTTTSTGQQIAREAASETLVPVYCPLDWYPFSRRALARFKPAMMLIFEVEIWPNLIVAAHRRGIPLALINCRMSDTSAAGYAKRRGIFGPLLRRFSLITAQSAEDAARVRRIAGETLNLQICGTMKYDQVAESGVIAGNALAAQLPAAHGPVLLGASTHPGEAGVLARAFCELRKSHPDLCLVVVPRHVEKKAGALAELTAAGLEPRLLSELRSNGERSAVILGDVTGELMAITAAADLVFVGKSFGDLRGGQNPIEAALLGKAIFHGPNMDNFRQVIADFAEADATVTVATEAEVLAACERLLANDDKRAAMGQRAKAVVAAKRGAVARTIAHLRELPGIAGND